VLYVILEPDLKHKVKRQGYKANISPSLRLWGHNSRNLKIVEILKFAETVLMTRSNN